MKMAFEWAPLDYSLAQPPRRVKPFNGTPVLTWTPTGIYQDVWVRSTNGPWGSGRRESEVLFWMDCPTPEFKGWIDARELQEHSIDGIPPSQTIIICHVLTEGVAPMAWNCAYFDTTKNHWITDEGWEVLQALVRGGAIVPLQPPSYAPRKQLQGGQIRGLPDPIWA